MKGNVSRERFLKLYIMNLKELLIMTQVGSFGILCRCAKTVLLVLIASKKYFISIRRELNKFCPSSLLWSHDMVLDL